MKKQLSVVILLLAFILHVDAQKLKYSIDVSDLDTYFKVTLEVDGKLKKENSIYQFASTAPGTYQVMNIGRFVKNFQAFDKKGKKIDTEKVSVNQYKISDPQKVKVISYEIAETWDTPVEEHVVYKMCGTSLEKDHALINPHCVIGFPSGMQGSELSLELVYPSEWKIGTALNPTGPNEFIANSYDHLIDSPILLGRLTEASTEMENTKIEIFTYSKTDVIQSEQLMQNMLDMLKAADEFLVDFPVNRYTFLYHFEDESWGAWEHSFSSEYVYTEMPLTEHYANSITATAAHEFFHIITPLNIHSELIEQFNFETPTPSEHLWLYEGVTEWAADILQLRGGIYTLEEYLSQQQQKLINNDKYDPDYSLSKLALTSYTDEGQSQYSNIYSKGAVIASLLDLRLLELSGGERGLREVIIDLSRKYGQKRAFPEDQFFQIFVDMTFPEIDDFINNYIKGAKPLPLKDYYGKLGINYQEQQKTGNKVPSLGYTFAAPGGELAIVNLNDEIKELGLENGDKLLAVNGEKVDLKNASHILGPLMQLEAGSKYTITVKRSSKEITKDLVILSKDEVLKHSFEVDEKAPKGQLSLRAAWMKNLDYN